jgi:hypothetical protein
MAIVSIGVCSHLTTRRRKLWRIHTASRFCNLTDETSPTSCGSTGPVEYLSPRKTSPRVNIARIWEKRVCSPTENGQMGQI